MFQGWHRKLYGRRPLWLGLAMQRKAVELSTICLRQAKDLFGDLLATGLLGKSSGFQKPLVFTAGGVLDVSLPGARQGVPADRACPQCRRF